MPDVEEAGILPTRVLLAEDDPVSAAFLSEALKRLGMQVHCCGDGERALELARRERFSLLLLDCRMPGLGAQQILAALHADARAASAGTPVLATSADVDARLERELHAAGCRGVLAKPLRLDDLEQALRSCLSPAAETLIDDQAGLEASGSMQNLQALRGLFMTELSTLAAELTALENDPCALRERLHRLRASCGFCGASALASACVVLGNATDPSGRAQRERALATFRQALMATLQALQERPGPAGT